MKKILFSLLAVTFLISAAEIPNTLNYAEYLADKHIIVRQRPVENYALSDRVLRQEVVGIALRLTGGNFRGIDVINLPDPYTCKNLFSDVGQNKPNSWACRSVEIAAENNIISTANLTFRPEDDITRAEAIGMILSAVKLKPEMKDTITPWQNIIMEKSEELDILLDDTITLPDEKITR